MRTTSPLDLATRMRLTVTRTARLLRQEAHSGLSPSQGSALAMIERHGPLTPSELAQRERVQRPTVTRMVARLEAGGLVARAADPGDGRSSLLSLTPEGRALLDEVRGRKDAYLARLLRELADDERAVLEQAATILERVLEGDRAAPDGDRAARDGGHAAPDGDRAARDGGHAAPDGDRAARGGRAVPDGDRA